jgi:type IV pilus assembly protein PilA
MLQRLRRRAHGQEGFTLIELLVVILIIGILAAVAIPAFLNQKGKAQDANVKSDIGTAQQAEETYNTNSAAGGYIAATTGSTATNLTSIEQSLTGAFASPESLTVVVGGSALDGAASTGTGGGAVAYTISANDPNTVNFALTKYADGSIARSCNVPTGKNASGCTLPSGSTSGNGTW